MFCKTLWKYQNKCKYVIKIMQINNISGLTFVTEFGPGETLFDAFSKREGGQQQKSH